MPTTSRVVNFGYRIHLNKWSAHTTYRPSQRNYFKTLLGVTSERFHIDHVYWRAICVGGFQMPFIYWFQLSPHISCCFQLSAALWALDHDVAAVIANGFAQNSITDIVDGKRVGTFFTKASVEGPAVEVQAMNGDWFDLVFWSSSVSMFTQKCHVYRGTKVNPPGLMQVYLQTISCKIYCVYL